MITNSAIAGQIPFMNANVRFKDYVIERKDEIIDAFLWANKTFHDRYDKDKIYDTEVGRTYMSRMFDEISNTLGNFRGDQEADVVIVPVIAEGKTFYGKKVLEAWKEEPFKKMIEDGRFHELEITPIIFRDPNEEIEDATRKGNILVILGGKKSYEVEGKILLNEPSIKIIQLRK
ncbi:hypothetical protein CM19_11165 [Candidatus Acidianus copahuensis]|uniref:Uncharacterized protein n=1 Tax=Candidatus Acidianus copahuensis TaxID=1160895 RepID=A0A031LLK9_9CREN|nr:hypothetical protein [Candidatus Acidianus copahuensis]EZQ02119.1 hypothetical protein CM19_11165 [Candidatus Acidianus copahuensis]